MGSCQPRRRRRRRPWSTATTASSRPRCFCEAKTLLSAILSTIRTLRGASLPAGVGVSVYRHALAMQHGTNRAHCCASYCGSVWFAHPPVRLGIATCFQLFMGCFWHEYHLQNIAVRQLSNPRANAKLLHSICRLETPLTASPPPSTGRGLEQRRAGGEPGGVGAAAAGRLRLRRRPPARRPPREYAGDADGHPPPARHAPRGGPPLKSAPSCCRCRAATIFVLWSRVLAQCRPRLLGWRIRKRPR